jgi:hypothetical protein
MSIVNCVMKLASCETFTHLFILSESALNQIIELIPLQVQVGCKAVMYVN